jgi:alpha/beta superfamily hydrolase
MQSPNKQITDNFSREAVWLTKGDAALFSWLYLPTRSQKLRIGFVLCPPLGHEYVHTYRSYRKLAEVLATAGIPVIKFDLLGAGNSSGDALIPDCLGAWQESILTQIEFLKAKVGVKDIALFGVRMGATLAIKTCAVQAIAQLIVWRPVLNGKQYVRELSALSKFSASENSSTENFIESGGFVVTSDTLTSLGALNLTHQEPVKVTHLLEINDAQAPSEKLQKIFADTVSHEYFRTSGYDAMMAEPQDAEIPDDVIEKISAWSCRAVEASNTAAQNMTAVPIESSSLRIEGVVETACFIKNRLFSIFSQPAPSAQAKPSIIIFCNSGAVHTVGPNRLYTELSRGLVAQGYSTLRLDLHNLGDSVSGKVEKDNHPYPDEDRAVADVLDAIAFLKTMHPSYQIVVAGVCSGSYWAYRTAAYAELGVINEIYVINPLTFHWFDGCTLETPQHQGAIRDKLYYMDSAKNKEKWIKLLKGQVDFKKLLRVAGKIVVVKIAQITALFLEWLHLLPTTPLANDLINIRAKKIGIRFIFSSLDPGFELLQLGGGAKIKSMLKQQELSTAFIQGADHTFSKAHHRQELLAKLLGFLPK